MSSRREPGILLVGLNTAALFAVTAFSAIAYPELAIQIDPFLGGRGGSGSSLAYYRDFYVLPAALSFLVVSAAAIALAARRGRRALLIIALVAWCVLLAGLIGSTKWHYAAVRNEFDRR